jgi:L-alanine-DL-glutamate epimerase-like enolase superfamily enzyme
VVAVVAGPVFAGARGLRAWRDFRRFRRRALEPLVGLTERLETTERRLAAAGATAVRLDGARASLERSLAQARVLADAAGEARVLVDQVRGFAPRP